MNFPYRALLAFVSTFWLVVIYIINDDDLCFCHRVLATTVCLAIPILLSWLSLQISSFLGTDSPGKLHDIHLADGEFLPTYLGYFFVALSISDLLSLIFIYLILLVFVYLSQTQYFNPIYLLFGYHFYHATTEHGTNIFIVAYGKVIRNDESSNFSTLIRLNDTTYLSIMRKSQ